MQMALPLRSVMGSGNQQSPYTSSRVARKHEDPGTEENCQRNNSISVKTPPVFFQE